MGFFNTFKRLVSGKPPFEVSKQSNQGGVINQQGSEQTMPGPKVVPEVRIERTTSHLTGANMQITCIIQNNAQMPIELDKIELLSASYELNTLLQPGQERQFNVYNGSRPNNMNYRTAELYYKNQQGDYFCANHNIEYQQEPDNTYTVVEMKLMYPIRDV
jgi:hypothetical protein